MAFPGLKSQRLVLRKLIPEDQNELLEILKYRSNPETEINVLTFIQKIDQDYDLRQTINWGIVLDEKLIGTCGYYRGFANNSGEIGFVMRKAFRGKGYMKEALKTIIAYGFDVLHLDNIRAYTKDENKQAIALIQKLGFEHTNNFYEDYRKYIRKSNK